MENKKSKRIFKVVMAAMSLALVAAISYGATVAFMSSKTNDKNNVFKSSASLDVKLEENEIWTDVESVAYYPDSTIPKDPKISVGSETEHSDTVYTACRIMFLVEDDGGELNQEGENYDSVKDAGKKRYKAITYNDFKKVADFYTESGDNADNVDHTISTPDGMEDSWCLLGVSKSNENGLILYYGEEHTGEGHYDLKLIEDDQSSTVIFNSIKFKGQEALQKKYIGKSGSPGVGEENSDTAFCLYGTDDAGNPVYKNLVVKVFAYAIDSNMAGTTDKTIENIEVYPDASNANNPAVFGQHRGQNVLNKMIVGISVDGEPEKP